MSNYKKMMKDYRINGGRVTKVSTRNPRATAPKRNHTVLKLKG